MAVQQHTYVHGDDDRDFIIGGMKKYVQEEQELDRLLKSLIAPVIEGRQLTVLDAACGIGHLSRMVSELSPDSSYLGVDQTPYLIEQARELWAGKLGVSFEVGDVCDLPARYGREFDVSISWKTISWLPYYEEMVRALLDVTRKHLFISSLFYDGDIDFEIRVREFRKEAGRDGHRTYYNVYSYPRFREFLRGLGVEEVHATDFHIGIDLPRPPVDQMGTYTVRMDDGHRLQLSGVVLMAWKVIRIDV
jgi:SAM-dependent methyltransferase